MSDKPGLPKIDLKSFVGQIKSVIASTADEPSPLTGDHLGYLMRDISRQAKQLAEDHAQLTQGLYELNQQVTDLFDALEKFRELHPDAGSASDDTSAAADKKSTQKKKTRASATKQSK